MPDVSLSRNHHVAPVGGGARRIVPGLVHPNDDGTASCPLFGRRSIGASASYDALPIHFCNSASGTLRPCSGRI